MNVPDLDILAGLEDAYFSIVRFLGGVTGNTISAITPPAQRPLTSRTKFFSATSQLRGIYTSFTAGRKQWWSRVGGDVDLSGLAYFKQVNSARIQTGRPVIYEPPVPAGNKIKNGTFWGADGFPWVAGSALAEYKGMHIRVLEDFYVVNTLIAYQTLSLKNNTSYEINFEYYSFQDDDGDLGVGFGNNLGALHYFNLLTGGVNTPPLTITTPASGSENTRLTFAIRGQVYYLLIAKVSVVEL